MTLIAPTFVYGYGRNGRAQLLWEGVPGAAGFNLYRDGALIRPALLSNLWVDFDLTNGTAYSYETAAVDGNGQEGAHSAAVSVTPNPPTATQFRYRQVLGDMLRFLVVEDGMPAMNSAFEIDAASKGQASPILTLTEADVIRGASFAVSETTLCVDVMGETVAERFTEGLSSVVFSSQVLILVPTAGASNRPEDRSFIGDVIVDNLRTLLGSAVSSCIPALSPKTGNWLLPGRSVFHDCHTTRILRMNQPVKMADTVSRVPAWLLMHEATIEMSQDDLMRTG